MKPIFSEREMKAYGAWMYAHLSVDTREACPDGGTCHHGCKKTCWRVDNCSPLSGVFPDDEWPADVYPAAPMAHNIDTLAQHITICVDYLQNEAASIAEERGYFEHPEYLLPVMLTHRVIEELLELTEVYARQQETHASDKIPPFTRAEEEWSDGMIKLLRIGGRYGFRPEALIAKLKYERTRETTRSGKIF